MTQQQTFTIKQGIRLQAVVSNNHYLLLMNIHNLVMSQGKEWYEANEGLSEKKFLAHLGSLVNYGNFSGEGVAKAMLKMQAKGYLIVEPLRVQVTEKWTAIVEEYGGYLNHGDKTTVEVRAIEDQELLKKIDDVFKEITQPTTQNYTVYKKKVQKFVNDARRANKRGLLSSSWKERLEQMEKASKSDFLLKQFFEAMLKANAEADKPPNAPPKNGYTEGGYIRQSDAKIQENINALMNWRIELDMTEKQFHEALKNTRFWIMQKATGSMKLSESERSRLEFVLKYVDSKTADNSGKRKAFYQLRISQLTAQKAEHQGPVDATIAAVMAKAKLTTVKEA